MVNGPLPLGIFVCEGEQGFGKIGKSGDEFLIKVAAPDERSDCFYVNWGSPVFDCIKFGGVHFYGFRRDEETEIFYLGGVEGAFGEFESESLFTESLKDVFGSFLVENEVVGRVD